MDTLQITDGTVTADFSDYSTYGYRLLWNGWRPKRARRLEDIAGAHEIYEEVEEEIEVLVSDLNKADVLSDLLDQADRWRNGTILTPVALKYKHANSGLTNAPSAVIVGSPRGRDGLVFPRDFDAGVAQKGPIVLRFRRRPLFLGDTEQKSAATSSGNPAIMTTANFTDNTPIPWPFDLDLQQGGGSALSNEKEMNLLITNEADKLWLAEGESYQSTSVPGSSTVTTPAVSGASGGNVARITPNTVGEHILIWQPDSGTKLWAIDSSIRNISVDLVLANNSSAITWKVYARLVVDGLVSTEVHESRKEVVDTSTTNPQTVSLGIVGAPADLNGYQLHIVAEPSSNDGAGDELDIDYVAVIGLDDNANIIRIPAAQVQSTYSLFIRHRLDTHKDGLVEIYNSSGGTHDYSPAYKASSIKLHASGQAVSVLMFGHDGAGDWVILDSLSAEVDYDLVVTRTKAYLTPV